MRDPRSLRSFFLVLLVGASDLACAGGGMGGPRELSESDTSGVLEAVYRYQLAHDVRPDTAAFCLCTPSASRESGDPPAGLLERFAGEPRPVVACSACSVEEGRIVLKASGKTALTLFVADLRPLLAGELEVEGVSRVGRFSSARQRYRVVRQGTGWKVADVLGAQVR